MSFFVSDAFAAEGVVSPGVNPISDVVFFLLIGVALFFLVFLPQLRRNKEQKKLLQSLNKGAEVVTSGGILGRIVEVDDNFVLLEIYENINISVQKHSVTQLMPKGTYKARKKTEK